MRRYAFIVIWGLASWKAFMKLFWRVRLRAPGIVERQRPIDIEFEDMRFEAAFRIDLLVQGRLLIEIKSTDQLHRAHAKQLLTYLRLTKHPVGLLINFGGATLMEGFKRLVNDY